MLEQFLYLFELSGKNGEIVQQDLCFKNRAIKIENGIPRFVPNKNYSSGNFSLLREKYSTLQLDSKNGTNERQNLILSRTGWKKEFFRDKVVLECGCGAGPDTEILLNFGAKVVAVDIAGLDIADANLGKRKSLCLVQADIANLPLKKEKFDIVFCHRVIQHTPNPEATLDHILKFVKPEGSVFIHSYSRDFLQMFRWKYALRPITKKINPETLYFGIKKFSPFLFWLTNAMNRLGPIGRRLAWIFVPFINHASKPKFKNQPKTVMLEHAVHDTFDALSPPFDNPLSEYQMHKYAKKYLKKPFKVETQSAITLLKSC